MTSPVDTSVKFFHSKMIGAPVLTGQAGSQIALLDALLVNGFGLKSVDSLVVSNGVATITIASGHSAEVGTVVLVAGGSIVALNGEQKATAATSTTVSFATTEPNGTSTGTITMKIAPAGWTKQFSDTNLAVYKSPDPSSTGLLLRIDDTAAMYSRALGYESMSDVNTGVAPFPSSNQVAGGLWWSKSNSANSTPRGWYFAADSKIFYLFKAHYSSYTYAFESAVFGDFPSRKSGDAYNCFIHGPSSDYSSTYPQSETLMRSTTSIYSTQFIARSYTGLGGAIRMTKTSPFYSGGADYFSGASGPAYPNASDGGLYVSPWYLSEESAAVLRGHLCGVYSIPMTLPIGAFSAGDTITGVEGLSGRKLKFVTLGPSAPNGGMLIDITGPWR